MAKSPKDPYRHIRRQVPPPGWAHKSPRDYDRRDNKRAIDEELKELEEPIFFRPDASPDLPEMENLTNIYRYQQDPV